MPKGPLMKRLLALFKKTHEKDDEANAYPPELNADYEVTKKTLGVGSFAVVKECIHHETKKPYALKIIMKKVIAGKYCVQSFPLVLIEMCLVVVGASAIRQRTHVG